MWEMITWAMAGLGSAAAAATEEDLQELQSGGSSGSTSPSAAAGEAGSGAAAAAGAAEGSGAAMDGASSGDSEEEAEELVEYEGMLVSAAAAQRRRCAGTAVKPWLLYCFAALAARDAEAWLCCSLPHLPAMSCTVLFCCPRHACLCHVHLSPAANLLQCRATSTFLP